MQNIFCKCKGFLSDFWNSFRFTVYSLQFTVLITPHALRLTCYGFEADTHSGAGAPVREYSLVTRHFIVSSLSRHVL
jgi:hypothetical protein